MNCHHISGINRHPKSDTATSSEGDKSLKSKRSGGKTVFNATQFNYYVLADNADNGGTADPIKPTEPNTLKIGDRGKTAIRVILLFIYGGAVITIVLTKIAK